MTRPIKSAGPKARRQRLHKTRLVALGMDEKIVAKMDVKSVRTLLKHPKKVVAAVAD